MTCMTLALTLTAALAIPGPIRGGGIEVEEIGSFHIGGRQATRSGLPKREITFTSGAQPVVVDSNGDLEVEQMYVQYVRLAHPKAKYPLLMWHGGGLTGVTWETTPDGRPGWQMFFLGAGHSVYVSDAVERGRASWPPYPEIFRMDPIFRTKKEAWELFRIGPADSYAAEPSRRVTHTDQQFPTDSFDQFMKQSVPRWAGNDAATQASYDALVQKVCPCVVMMHSQGANFGFNAALRAPDKVRAVIAVEGSGAPDPAKGDLRKLRGIPHLFLWGDYLGKQSLWIRLVPNLAKYRDALRAAGVAADWIELPQHGIKGNSHMLMMDRNSDQVADIVQDWLVKQGLMK